MNWKEAAVDDFKVMFYTLTEGTKANHRKLQNS
jgi:hypothetical protein